MAAAAGGGGYGADNNNDAGRPLEPAPAFLQCVMLGGVDSGKSTLLGTILAASGAKTERDVAKQAREAEELGKTSFRRAFLVDRLKDERERGITISPPTGGLLVRANEYGSTMGLERSLVIRDAPGHRDFTKALLRQCVAADVGILVLPFDDSFQARLNWTQYQLLAARAIGVEELVVALVGEDVARGTRPRTTTELEAKYTDCMDELDKVFRRCGYDKCMRSIADLRDADADGGAWGTPVVVCSGLHGVHVGAQDEAGHTGVGQDCEQLHAFWSMAPRPFANLAAALNRPNLGARSQLGRCPRVGDAPLESLPLRALISDVFRLSHGIGTVAVAHVLQGTLRPSVAREIKPYRVMGARRVAIWGPDRSSRSPPEGEEAHVRSIEAFYRPYAEAGPNAVVGATLPDLRGEWSPTKWKVLAEAHTACVCVTEFVATVMIIEPPPGANEEYDTEAGPLLTPTTAAAVKRPYNSFREGSVWPTLVGVALTACRVKRIEKVDCKKSEQQAGRDIAANGMQPAAEMGRWAVPGTSARVVFEPKFPLCAEAFVDCPTLGRLVAFERHFIVCFGRIESVTHGGEGERMPGGATKAARKGG